MKTRLFAIGLACISAGLVACGGGGGGGGTPPIVTPTITPTITPTTPPPTPTPNPYGCVGQTPFASAGRHSFAQGPRPIASGDNFSYSGTLSQTVAQSAPCPQPTATTAAVVNVTIADTTASSPTGAIDSKSTETDAFPTITSTTTTDSIVQNTGTQVLLYSTSSSDGNGNTVAMSYTTPQILDKLPETSGNTWGPNDPSGTLTETIADGTSINRTIKSDGSYIDTQTSAGATSIVTVDGASNSTALDGSGSYNLLGSVTFQYAAPTGAPGTGTITLSIVQPGVATKTRTFPAWFTPSNPFISDTFADNGVKSFPAGCGVNAAIGTSGEQIVETQRTLDPVLGYIDTRTTTSYVVNGFGPACITISDVMASYYDYTNDTTKIDYQSQNGQPNRVDTITETLGMTNPTSPYSGVRRPESVQPVNPALVIAREAAIEHVRAIQRAQTLTQLRTFAQHITAKGATR